MNRRCSAALALVLVLGACKDEQPEPKGPLGSGKSVSATVTSAMGGTLELEGAVLDVPPGALPAGMSSVEITLTSTKLSPPGLPTWASPVYRLEPEGFRFGKPVTLTVPIPGQTAGVELLWTRLGNTALYENVGGKFADKKLSGSNTHFSLATARAGGCNIGTDPSGSQGSSLTVPAATPAPAAAEPICCQTDGLLCGPSLTCCAGLKCIGGTCAAG